MGRGNLPLYSYMKGDFMYIFYSKPNKQVYSTDIKKTYFNKRKRSIIKIAQFNENGEFYTNDDNIFSKLSNEYKYDKVEDKPTETETEAAPVKVYTCKQCGEKFDNKGKCLSHIRAKHPKKE